METTVLEPPEEIALQLFDASDSVKSAFCFAFQRKMFFLFSKLTTEKNAHLESLRTRKNKIIFLLRSRFFAFAINLKGERTWKIRPEFLCSDLDLTRYFGRRIQLSFKFDQKKSFRSLLKIWPVKSYQNFLVL